MGEYPAGYAWGRCPLGCGAVGGDLVGDGGIAGLPAPGTPREDYPPHTRYLPHGFVKLWPHLSPRCPHLGVCIGSRQLAAPLPLAAPTDADRAACATQLAEATAEMTLF